MRIAGVQLFCSEDKKRNVEKGIRFAEIAAEKGAQIVCYPELASTHWFPKEMIETHFSLAEAVDGPSVESMQEVARARDIVLVYPFFEKDGTTYYNSAAVIDAGGELLGLYRKVHVPQIPLWEEKYYFTPGNLGFPVFKTKHAALGVQICWDNFFPEGAGILALKGAEIIFAPTAAAFASQKKWETVISAHAASNGLFLFRVNRVGSEEKQDFYGRSFCVSPEGDLVDRPTGMNEGIALVDVDLKAVDAVRKEWSFFKDRRPETYGEILSLKQPTREEPTEPNP